MTEDFYVRYADMPPSVKAYTVFQDGYYTIILNSRLCRESNMVSYIHELKHISDMDFEKQNADLIEKEKHQ